MELDVHRHDPRHVVVMQRACELVEHLIELRSERVIAGLDCSHLQPTTNVIDLANVVKRSSCHHDAAMSAVLEKPFRDKSSDSLSDRIAGYAHSFGKREIAQRRASFEIPPKMLVRRASATLSAVLRRSMVMSGTRFASILRA